MSGVYGQAITTGPSKMVLRSVILAALISTPAYSANYLRGSMQHDDWRGFHIGIQAASAHTSGRSSLEHVDGATFALNVANGLFPEHARFNQRALSGSVSAGFNMQRNNVVGGLEADYSLLNLSSYSTQSQIDPNPNAPFAGQTVTTGFRTEFSHVATVRARVGIAFDKSLVYATAGLAGGHVNNEMNLSQSGIAFNSTGWSTSKYQYGYVIGGGFEHKLSPNLRMRFEVQHINLADTKITGTDAANLAGQSVEYKFDNDMTIAKVGLGYSF